MAFWLTRCLAECLKTIASFFSLPTLPLFIFTSSPTFTPLSFFPPSLRNRDSPVSLFPSLWLGALDSSLHAFQGPEAFGKTSRLFQSNKERQVRVIQICDASKQTSCTQLLWWITKTKRNIESGGGEGLLVEWKPAPLPDAKKMSGLVVRQPGMDVIFLCFLSMLVHSPSLFSHD